MICYLQRIEKGAFARCPKLYESIKLPASVEHCGDAAFFKSGIFGMYVTANLNIIPELFCGDCPALESVLLDSSHRLDSPQSHLHVLPGAFYNCTHLTELSIYTHAKVWQDVFSKCSHLKEIMVLNERGAPRFLDLARFDDPLVAHTVFTMPDDRRGDYDKWVREVDNQMAVEVNEIIESICTY
jgi:hypothetical protein